MPAPRQVPRGTAVGAPKTLIVTQAWDNFHVQVTRDISQLQPAGVFANNAAAVAGGLNVGQFYNTATGEVRVVV